MNVHAVMAKAKKQAREGDIPVLIHRRNDTEWLVTMRAEDWAPFYAESGLVEAAGSGPDDGGGI
jgi:hypothetical protein